MNSEFGKLYEEKLNEKKNQKKLKEKNEDEKIKFKKKKEKISSIEKSEKELFELKEILNNGKIDEKTKEIIYKTIQNEFISNEEIEEIFKKIEEIENIAEIDKFLPKENRISKEEYKKAINDDVFRIQVLTKINIALTILANQISPENGFGLNMFKGYLLALDKNLITIQENHIDIKNSLEDIDYKKYGNKLNLWQKIIIFIKNLFKK